jgi:hypothetical protein
MPEHVVSLKVRDNVSSDDEYRKLLDCLCHECEVQHTAADGDIQDRAHILSLNNSRVILVEHETGLELLYIAGSVASLIQLIPLVLQKWNALRRWSHGRGPGTDSPIEMRRINESGQIYENHMHGQTFLGVPAMDGAFTPALATAAEILHTEVSRVFVEVQTLSARLDALEKRLKPTPKPIRNKVKTSARKPSGRGKSK